MNEELTSQQYAENMLQAMSMIAENALAKAQFDKTYLCKIVEASDAAENGVYKYTLQYEEGNRTFVVYDEQKYYANSSVWVKVPQGDWGSTGKKIEGRQVTTGQQKTEVLDYKDRLIVVDEIEGRGIHTLSTSESYSEVQLNVRAIDINLLKYNLPQQLDGLGVSLKWKFTPNDPATEFTAGNYGLKMNLYSSIGLITQEVFDIYSPKNLLYIYKNNIMQLANLYNDKEEYYVCFTRNFDSREILGNPYMDAYFPYTKLFLDINSNDSFSLNNISKVDLFLYTENFTEEQGKVFIKDIKLDFGYLAENFLGYDQIFPWSENYFYEENSQNKSIQEENSQNKSIQIEYLYFYKDENGKAVCLHSDKLRRSNEEINFQLYLYHYKLGSTEEVDAGLASGVYYEKLYKVTAKDEQGKPTNRTLDWAKEEMLFDGTEDTKVEIQRRKNGQIAPTGADIFPYYGLDKEEFKLILVTKDKAPKLIDSKTITFTNTKGEPTRYIVDLSDESSVLVCDGNKKPISAFQQQVSVSLYANNSLIPDATYSCILPDALSGKITINQAGNTFTISTNKDIAFDKFTSYKIEFQASIGSDYKGSAYFTLSTIQSGEITPVYEITTDIQVIVKDVTQSITITPEKRIGSEVTTEGYFEVYVDNDTGTPTETGSETTKYSIGSQLEPSKKLIIKLYKDSTSTDTVLDQETIPVIQEGKEGKDATYIDLDNEYSSVYVDENGYLTVDANITSNINIWQGSTSVTDKYVISPSSLVLKNIENFTIDIDNNKLTIEGTNTGANRSQITGDDSRGEITVIATTTEAGLPSTLTAVFTLAALKTPTKYEVVATPNEGTIKLHSDQSYTPGSITLVPYVYYNNNEKKKLQDNIYITVFIDGEESTFTPTKDNQGYKINISDLLPKESLVIKSYLDDDKTLLIDTKAYAVVADGEPGADGKPGTDGKSATLTLSFPENREFENIANIYGNDNKLMSLDKKIKVQANSVDGTDIAAGRQIIWTIPKDSGIKPFISPINDLDHYKDDNGNCKVDTLCYYNQAEGYYITIGKDQEFPSNIPIENYRIAAAYNPGYKYEETDTDYRAIGTPESNKLPLSITICPKETYTPASNEIRCEITLQDETAVWGNRYLQFGTFGTSGTGFGFNAYFEGAPYIIPGETKTVSIILTDDQGNNINDSISDPTEDIEISWLNVKPYDSTQPLDPERSHIKIDTLIVAEENKNIHFDIECHSDFLSNSDPQYQVLKITLKNWTSGTGNNPDLTTYLQVPVYADDSVRTSGPSRIVYNMMGNTPSYVDEYFYGRYNNQINDSPQQDGKMYQGITILRKKQIEEDNKSFVSLSPPINFSNGLYASTCYIKYSVYSQEQNKRVAFAILPMLFIQNTYESAIVNDWNGSSVKLENNYIMSPLIGAGAKFDDNKFTGVLMGDVQNTGKIEGAGIGLYGFNQGSKTFELNATNGSLFFGNTNSNITFDTTDNKITINTDNLNLDENGNLTITGIINATSGHIGPLNAGWIISGNSIYNTAIVDTEKLSTGIQSPAGIWSFWAGAPVNTQEQIQSNIAPFRVSHSGELFASKGKIGDFEIVNFMNHEHYDEQQKKIIKTGEPNLYVDGTTGSLYKLSNILHMESLYCFAVPGYYFALRPTGFDLIKSDKYKAYVTAYGIIMPEKTPSITADYSEYLSFHPFKLDAFNP